MRKELQDSAAALERIQAERNRPMRVMVIDDEPDCFEFIRRALVDAECVWATTGEDGLQMLALEMEGVEENDPLPFHAIIVDERLPGDPGHLILKSIRARWPKLNTVLCSGWKFDEETAEEIKTLRLTMVLTKPIEKESVAMLRSFAGQCR